MTNTFSLNLNKTLIVSVLLHAGFFAAAVVLSVKTIPPRPLGVELAYDATPVTSQVLTTPAAASATPTKVPVAAARVEKEDFTLKNKASQETVYKAAVPTTSTTAQSGALSGREGVSQGAEVSPEDRYLYELKKLLERRKSYPMIARKMGHMGTVMMRFTLKADGTLAESEVVAKAPYETLNQAASSLVQGINGLKPFPQEIKRDSWSITVPIEYTLN